MASLQVCSEPGCPTYTKTGRCPVHRREQRRARGTDAANGYGPDHRAARRAIQDRIDAGETVLCWRCRAVLVGRKWQLDHTADRKGYRGPACIPCNTALGGTASADRQGRGAGARGGLPGRRS